MTFPSDDDALFGAVPEEEVFRLIDVAYRYYFKELSLAEIGTSYGVSRERVRQWLRVLPPTVRGVKGRSRIYWNKARLKTLDTIIERLNEGIVCSVCGAWVIRRKPGPSGTRDAKFPTCSTTCHEVAQAAMPRTSPEAYERHRVYMARSYLKNPEGKKPSQLAWAKAMLSDNPPPPNRRFSLPDSKATKALRRVGVST